MTSPGRTPEALLAHRIVHEAIQAGRLLRATCCEQCGDEPERHLIHGHHDDYSQPLNVRWLCRPCHVAHHRTLNGGKRQRRVAT